MKKIVALVLALCMVFALCACGSSDSASSSPLIYWEETSPLMGNSPGPKLPETLSFSAATPLLLRSSVTGSIGRAASDVDSINSALLPMRGATG